MNRRRWRQLVVCACIAGAIPALPSAAHAVSLEPVALPAATRFEVEPNNAIATATPISSGERIRASLPMGDVDCYGFTASAGDRLFANTVTAGSSGGFDTELRLLDESGSPVPGIADDDDGSQFKEASNIAGAVIPASGSYCLEVLNGGTAAIAQYDLYFQLRSGSPVAETDATNGSSSTADSLASGWVSGSHETAGDEDWYSLPLQAGDTVFLSLALAGEASNAQLGFGLTGDADNQVLSATAEGELPDATAPSEAFTMTVSRSGTYYVKVAARQPSLTEIWTYDLSASVIPAVQPSCRSYSSAVGEIKDAKTMIFPIPVEDAVEISRASVSINLVESVMADLDVSLRTPAAVELPLFNDIGSTSSGGQTQMDAVFDDFAAVPSTYKVLRPLDLQPSGAIRLSLLANQPTQGNWGLVIRDDQLNSSVGTLKEARLILCGPDSLIPPGPGGSNNGSKGSQPQSNPPPKPAPVLSGFGIAPSKFRAAKAGPMTVAKRTKAGGALVSYRSSESAQTNLILYELEEGRKVGKKCVRKTDSNSTKKPCVRRVKVISFVRSDAAGHNQFGFTGRVGARKLPPGEYLLQARAYAPSGLTSKPVSGTFTVLPPTAKKESTSRRR